jgi:hypothetical protein
MTKAIYFKNRLYCANCGSKVTKEISKAGNSYLASEARPSIHGGYFSPAHDCQQREGLSFQDILIKEGEIVSGQIVKVVKGRKVAIGTVGEIMWLGENGFGDTYGLKLSDGSTVFVAAKNCEVNSTVAAGN